MNFPIPFVTQDHKEHLVELALLTIPIFDSWAFHIIVSDYNVEDSHFKSCMEDPEATEYEIQWGRKMLEVHPLEREWVVKNAPHIYNSAMEYVFRDDYPACEEE